MKKSGFWVFFGGVVESSWCCGELTLVLRWTHLGAVVDSPWCCVYNTNILWHSDAVNFPSYSFRMLLFYGAHAQV